MPVDTIYLPNTHKDDAGAESIPAVILVGDYCYEYIETISRDEQKETVCWDEVKGEYEECEDCCAPYVVYRECCDVFKGAEEPSILLTVTGASGTINWCGETWNLPDDSGVEKSVCPTGYGKDQVILTGYSMTYDAANIWTYNNSLYMRRWFKQIKGWGTVTNLRHKVKMNSTGTVGATDYRWIKKYTGAATSTISSTLTLGVLSGGSAMPTWSNYTITDAFFGSYTTGVAPNDITYTWAKDKGW